MSGGLVRSRDVSVTATKELVRGLEARAQIDVSAGAQLLVLVLSCTVEDTIGIDLASSAMVRLRVPWRESTVPDLAAFDVVEVTLSSDPERDDTAQPEAVTLDHLPRLVGTLRGGTVRRRLRKLQAPPDGPLLGFRGPSAPYWELRGNRPSVALIVPERGPQLLRRRDDGTTWVRFGWSATTSGWRSRIATRSGHLMPRDGTSCLARTSPSPSASSRATCWPRSANPSRATATSSAWGSSPRADAAT